MVGACPGQPDRLQAPKIVEFERSCRRPTSARSSVANSAIRPPSKGLRQSGQCRARGGNVPALSHATPLRRCSIAVWDRSARRPPPDTAGRMPRTLPSTIESCLQAAHRSPPSVPKTAPMALPLAVHARRCRHRDPPLLQGHARRNVELHGGHHPQPCRTPQRDIAAFRAGLRCRRHNLGGDLDLFTRLIREGNRDLLLNYAQRCVEGVHHCIPGSVATSVRSR